jgi:hypothetical protein
VYRPSTAAAARKTSGAAPARRPRAGRWRSRSTRNMPATAAHRRRRRNPRAEPLGRERRELPLGRDAPGRFHDPDGEPAPGHGVDRPRRTEASMARAATASSRPPTHRPARATSGDPPFSAAGALFHLRHRISLRGMVAYGAMAATLPIETQDFPHGQGFQPLR